MRTLIKQLIVIVCIFSQSSFAMEPDIYNNPRLIFHAIGPKFDLPQLEGIDPSVSITAIEAGLRDLVARTHAMPTHMTERIASMQKSLARAKTNYLICIGLVKLADEPACVSKMALELAEAAKGLIKNESDPSILFIGGHYLYRNGLLGGHTASYDAMRQDNGKLCFAVINTIKIEDHLSDGPFTYELVYSDLDEADLDTELWKNVIKTNYMNPAKGAYLMEAFYTYLDKKLNKGSNKTFGRSYRRQVKGVCGWKAISVWGHGKIAPSKRITERNASDELVYLHYKKYLFERMLACFAPGNSLDTQAAATLKTELENKIQQINGSCKLLQ